MLALLPAVVALLGITFLARRISQQPRRRLPPGPPGLPLIGNLLDIPTTTEWLRYEEFSKVYGDIVCLQALGQTLVILRSKDDTKELFATRGTIYSGRIWGSMAQMVGEGMITLPLGRKFRTIRRIFSSCIGPQAVKRCSGVQTISVSECLNRLVGRQRQDPFVAVKRMIGGTVLRLAYGYNVRSDDDHFVELAEKSVTAFLGGMQPGWLVDMFPILKHLPSSLPFAVFKRKAEQWHHDAENGLNIPWEWVKNRVATGVPTPSFAEDLLEDQDEVAARMAMRDMYGAGMDTTLAASLWLILALALHPEVQSRAQQEIDEVTLGERLPTLDDRARLPFIDAIIKEVLRWHPVVNLAVPHILTEDDSFHGYYLPKGSIVMSNVWSILHNPEEYPEPASFKPERHLPPSGISPADPFQFAFGLGPRQCPGRHLADTTLYSLATSTLATCTILNPINERGQTLTSNNLQYTSGIISRPAAFLCDFKPRDTRPDTLLSHGRDS